MPAIFYSYFFESSCRVFALDCGAVSVAFVISHTISCWLTAFKRRLVCLVGSFASRKHISADKQKPWNSCFYLLYIELTSNASQHSDMPFFLFSHTRCCFIRKVITSVWWFVSSFSMQCEILWDTLEFVDEMKQESFFYFFVFRMKLLHIEIFPNNFLSLDRSYSYWEKSYFVLHSLFIELIADLSA